MRDDQQLDICVSPKLWDTIQISDDWENNCPKSAFHFGIFPHCFRVHLPHLGPPGAKRMGLKHQTTAVTNGMFLRVDQQCLPTFCPPSRYLLFFLCWLHFGVSAQWFCRIVFEVLKHVSIPTKPLTMNHRGFCSHLSPILNVIHFFTTPLSGNVICLQRPGLCVFSGHVKIGVAPGYLKWGYPNIWRSN